MARLPLVLLAAAAALLALPLTAPPAKAVRAGADRSEPSRSAAEVRGAQVRADLQAGAPLARIIIGTEDAAAVQALVTREGGRTLRKLRGAGAVVAEVPHGAGARLAAHPAVRAVTPDRPMAGTLDMTSAAVGARWVRERLGFDGQGIGVAIIDSGAAAAHPDLAGGRIVHFADFVGFASEPYDGYGHGTHVAGIIAGSGTASRGARQGVAPGAHLIVLKALDDHGQGFISTAIAALDYAIEHRTTYDIRVINLSVAAGVYESYRTDPLTLAARRAVDAGIVVVTAAGNLGQANGQPQYGGITAPGNAPWVLTVGAASHNGTADPADDTVAPFSSRGPTAIDMVAKPDLVAPGVGIESLADPLGTLFAARPDARLPRDGTGGPAPYLSLSGTSMAAPVVAGTVALLLQANPALTPAAVKALLVASADPRDAYTQMAQGAGFLNARAAVALALAFAGNPAATEMLGAAAALALDADEAQNMAPVGVPPASFETLAGAVAGVAAPGEARVAPPAGMRAPKTTGTGAAEPQAGVR